MPWTMSSARKVPSRDISVVIQGPTYLPRQSDCTTGTAEECIASIRRYLPEAEIVLSTWKGQAWSADSVCKVIELEDPGNFKDVAGNGINVNRQILSTQEGIRAASRPYVLKFRANLELSSDDFCVASTYPDSVGENSRLLNQPVNVTTLFIRDPEILPMLFHVSDIAQFGRKEDLVELWDMPLFEKKDLLLPGGIRRNPFGNYAGHTDMRLVPEQALMLSWLQRKGFYDLTLNHISHVSPELLLRYEKILTENFNVVDWQDSGITFPMRMIEDPDFIGSVYTAEKLKKIAASLDSPAPSRARYFRILKMTYLAPWAHRRWWIGLVSMVLFRVSPRLAILVRAIYRRWKLTS